MLTNDALAAKKRKGSKKPTSTVVLPAAKLDADPGGFADNLEGEDEEPAQGDQDEEPTDDTSRTRHYVPKDGRNALVVTAGFATLMRTTVMTATNAPPPYYEGVLSPGMAFHLALFPWRFKEGGGVLRELGLNARVLVAFMPASLAQGPALVRTDVFYSVQAAIALRHVFGDQQSAIALGAELGLSVDAMTLAPELLLPRSAYVSPRATLLLEVPLVSKYLVWSVRAGILPVTALTAEQVVAYGTRKFALGIDASTGLRSTIAKDLVYAEVSALVTHYWHNYAGTGAQGFSEVNGRDLLFGVTASLGVTY